jgi:DNA-directed RNA polymerase specialized sigma24 family protein
MESWQMENIPNKEPEEYFFRIPGVGYMDDKQRVELLKLFLEHVTKDQGEVLVGLFAGQTAAEIALDRGCTVRAVERLRKRAISRIKAALPNLFEAMIGIAEPGRIQQVEDYGFKTVE